VLSLKGARVLTDYSQPSEKKERSRHWPFSILEMFARLLMGEPASVVPTRKLERLEQLERRERLRMAERAGDEEFLDQELARARKKAGDLKDAMGGTTPIAQWPAEDFTDSFDGTGEPK
jgi:hypothetical protein